MAVDDTLLDDPERLSEADVGGLLRATAMAGAQVRAASDAAAELNLAERLDIGRPRTLVLIARPGGGRSAVTLLAELLSTPSPVPVVVCENVPGWIGALDVVFAHSDDPGDRELAAGLERAARYGATVVVSAPEDGPVASAVAGRGLVLAPRLRLPPELSFPRVLASGLLTANALGLLVADVHSLADRLDDEAERGHLSHDSFSNPAKALAIRVADRTPALWGLDHIAVAVARHAQHAFAAHAGRVCDVAEFRQAMARPALYRAALSDTNERDIFADPHDPEDPATAGNLLRVVLLAVRTGPAADTARQHAEQALPSAEELILGDEILPDEPGRAAVTALRCELAAVYLGLAAGSTGGAVLPESAWM